MEGKWQSSTSLSDTNLHMLENEILCDVTFLAGESRQAVRAHRYMLVSRSPVFYAMFCGPMSEKTEEIQVPDIEANILKDLLRYMYSGIPKLNADTVMSLLYAANKYDVSGMVQACGQFLKSNITPENVCTMLQHVVLYDNKDIIKDCQDIVTANGKAVLKSEGFLSLTKEGLRVVLELDSLGVPEEEVFSSCIRWAKEQCRGKGQEGNDTECREALGDLLYLIRFPCMSGEYFTSHIANSGILSQEEKIDVFQQLCSSKAMGTFFTQTPRRKPTPVDLVISRFSGVTCSKWGRYNEKDAISFRCSQNAYLTGVSVYTPRTLGPVNSGNVELFKGDSNLVSAPANVSYRGNVLHEDIMFEKPQYIEKDVVYTVVQRFRGLMERYGGDGKERVQDNVCGLEITFLESSQTVNTTNTLQGQIPRLHFHV